MAIWILQNSGASQALADMRMICGNDPGLRVDGAGRVIYVQTVASVGANLLASLAQNVLPISVGVEGPFFNVGTGAYKILFGGSSAYDAVPGAPQLHLEVYYDPSGGTTGQGFYAHDFNRNRIPVPTHVLLFHELAHIKTALDGELDSGLNEIHTLSTENEYRASRGLLQRYGHTGGLYGDPSRDIPPEGPVFPANRRAERVVPGVVLLCTPYFADDTLSPGEVISGTYRVFIRNASTTLFTQVVIFYKRSGQAGIVFLRQDNLGPGGVFSFVLGIAPDMESYNVGFFDGDEMVAQIPALGTGSMTPVRASIENPDDMDATVDWWLIEDAALPT